ncbi:MAG: asparagine synthase (glutamine-hydrolyzing), partial [Alphaproteobacteria bacterium]
MCGIAGLIDLSARNDGARLERRAQRMAAALIHRGPDNEGLWSDADAAIALSHRRLSIIDLTPTGHLPMVSADGRVALTYNGEIYNHRDLRARLAANGTRFRGTSDSEVLVEAIAQWGIETALARINGMFAFAAWDRGARTLTLARDHFGQKPLYWLQKDGLFLFGSELRALEAAGGWTPEIDPGAVAAFMRHNYVPAPGTIFRHVRKLMPGTFLTVAADGRAATERPYWSLADVAADGIARPDPRPVEAQAAALDALIGEVVADCMVSDVPLGVFLSGGIDSSLVAAAMTRTGGPVRSFSLGFSESGFDEAPHAAAIARHLGTDHTELYVDGTSALDAVPAMARVYDEPFADSSQIPTWLISRLARRDVTVALTGDGGDEVFAGYRRYWSARRMWRLLASVPLPVRRLAARFVGLVPEPLFRALVGRLSDHTAGPRRRLDSRRTAAEVLATPDREALFRRIVSHWNDPSEIAPAAEARGLLWDRALGERFDDYGDWMQVMDSLTYLPDDILVKVDRAAMSVALETRVPLLDRR